MASKRKSLCINEKVLLIRAIETGEKISCSVRWFRLRGNLLFYLKGPDPWHEPIGVIVLGQHQIKLQNQDENGYWPFHIVWDNGICYRMATFHEAERTLWLKAIQMAPYDAINSQIVALKEKLNRIRAITDITTYRLQKGIVLDMNEVPLCELALSCDNLLCDAYGRPPSPLIVIYVKYSKGLCIKYGTTEIVETCSNPSFSKTILFRASDGLTRDATVRVVVYDVKERVSETAVPMGYTSMQLSTIQVFAGCVTPAPSNDTTYGGSFEKINIGLFFSLLFPVIQVVAFFLAVGHDPRDLHLAVVNDEATYFNVDYEACRNGSATTVRRRENETCDQHMMSCWFLSEMERRKLYATPYDSIEEAKHAVAKRTLYGALHFHRNFSEALAMRVADGDADDDTVDQSTISVWVDMTDYQISFFIKRQLHKTYEAFARYSMRACGNNEDLVQIPVRFEQPIYGVKEAEIVAYMAPGVMVTIIYFLAAIVTSTLMIADRLEGVWERSAVAGVRAAEMLQVHVVLQSLVILVQTLEMMVVSYLAYSLPYKGSLWTMGSLLFLQGLGGMCYGFLLSVLCSSYTLSFFIATGSFYPMILLCGIIWPLEGMPSVLRVFSFVLPFTLPAISLRGLMEKGSTILDSEVYNGFIITVAWIIGALALCFLRLKYKKT